MTVVELHPEELIDLEARGGLDAQGFARLEAHSARCVACRYERTMRAQFAGALREREPEPEPEPRQDTSAREEPRPERWRRIWLWVAAASVLVVGAHMLAPEPEHPAASPPLHALHAAALDRVPAESAAPRKRDATVNAATPEPARPRARGPTAAALFERANHARGRGDYTGALDAYRRLQRLFPASREARISYVAMGRMQLDRSDAAGALASFDRYEAWGNADVDAVVMAGRALALDELGADASAHAWAALLASHPETPYAEHARLRVAARSM